MGRSVTEPQPELRVRLSADTVSVPGARRFVRDGLADWGRTDVLDDAALCVTEMAGNAALHSGSSFMNVVLRDLTHAVRVSVEDAGGLVPVEAVVPQNGRRLTPADGGVLPLEEQPMTGRGLTIVSVLSEAWGIDETPHGRRIWAEITGDGVEHPVRLPQRAAAPGPADHGFAMPADWKVVRMLQCPAALGIRIDQQLDDLVRELQLIDTIDDDTRPRELGQLIAELVKRPAFARHLARRTAQEAAAAGLEHVDIEMPCPRELSHVARQMFQASALADKLAEERQLLSLGSTPEMVSLRTWCVECIVGQLEDDAEPVPYAEWLVEHPLPEVNSARP
jgi:anti-sigma regulatory factor (Ser/Thr protein kinase)